MGWSLGPIVVCANNMWWYKDYNPMYWLITWGPTRIIFPSTAYQHMGQRENLSSQLAYLKVYTDNLFNCFSV